MPPSDPPDPHRTADGVYRCAGCQAALFDSRDRDDGPVRAAGPAPSPGFRRPVAPECLTAHAVAGEAPVRVAIRCARCDAHLGQICLEGAQGSEPRYRPDPRALAFHPRS